jgi:hypothetical protein
VYKEEGGPLGEAEARKECHMPETMEQVQQEAYVRGQQMKQWHQEQQRVVSDEALTTLAADFAHISLFKSNQHISVAAAHERAGVCERAFLEGYRVEHS